MAAKKSHKGITHHIRKLREHPHLPWIIVAALAVVIILLFVAGVKIPFTQPGGIGSDLVDQKASKYIQLYLGFVNITVTNKTLDDDEWIVNVLAHAPDGLVALDLTMNATDFSITRISQSINMPTRPNTIKFLNKDVGCSIGDIVTTDVYIDPYDPWSIRYDSAIKGFLAKFSDSVRVSYRIVATYSFDSLKDPNGNAIHAIRYLECAKDTQYFEQIKTCIYAKYNQTKTFLTENETLACVSAAGMDATKAHDCANGQEAINAISIDERFASTFLGSPTTPAMVFDCRYETYPLFADYAFCYLYPNVAACKGQ